MLFSRKGDSNLRQLCRIQTARQAILVATYQTAVWWLDPWALNVWGPTEWFRLCSVQLTMMRYSDFLICLWKICVPLKRSTLPLGLQTEWHSLCFRHSLEWTRQIFRISLLMFRNALASWLCLWIIESHLHFPCGCVKTPRQARVGISGRAFLCLSS